MGNEIKTVLLKSVQLYDPDPKGICDLFLCGGRVAAVGRGLAPNLPGVAVLDGSGLTAFPGLVDQHVHFTGGGGECGFRSRVPELSLTDFTTAGVTTAVVINLTESLWIGVAAGLLLGVLCGLVNGFVIAKLKINALITTLATMQIVRGLAYIISDGKAVGIEDESFFALGYANWFGLPAPIWLTVACLIIFGLLLNKTTFGRNTLAIGGNEEAARLAGVPVVRTKIIIFVLSGLVSAIAGIILASRMTSGQPMTSIGYELIVISACVLGGVSLKGGIGKISYVVAGILILGTLENAMNLLNISPFAQYVVRGLILLAAVIFDRYKQKAKRTV